MLTIIATITIFAVLFVANKDMIEAEDKGQDDA